MKLQSLPETEKYHPMLTIGKEYEFLRTYGNGVLIEVDDGSEQIIILASRFQ